MYSFRITNLDSDTEANVTYTGENTDFISARMNYQTGEFEYGSWAEAFFLKKLKVVMLNNDGTEAYELNQNDYSKKVDGTPSDYNNTAFAGNVMAAFPKTYIKIVDNNDGTADVFVANKKLDDSYHCYAHTGVDGNELDYCYVATYDGATVDGKLRSISGLFPTTSTTREQEVVSAIANNDGDEILWNTGVTADRFMIQILLIMMAKTTDTYSAYGHGNNNGYNTNKNGADSNNYGVLKAGTMDTKGLFWGSEDDKSGVKVFGIENFWGNVWKSVAGWILDHGVQKIKMTYGQQDGSTVDGYNLDGNGYVEIADSTPDGSSGGYISEMIFNECGLIPKGVKGSSTTYYTDGLWFNNGIIASALVGGSSSSASRVGSCYADLGAAVSNAGWAVGASLSYKGKAPNAA